MKQTHINDEVKADFIKPEADITEHSADVRIGRALLKATIPFAKESIAKSWWYVVSTFFLMIVVLVGAGLMPWWPLRTVLSILGALLIVRAFIIYHDYMHQTILRSSPVAWLLFRIYGALALAPPTSWKKSHNYHHGHVGQLSLTSIGTFPIITTKMWHQASSSERAWYRIQRHPLTLMCGYVTVFALNICLLPLFRDPVRHWDSALSLVAHGGLITLLWVFGGFDMVFFVILLPMTIASALGSYLFFAQHNYKRMKIISLEAWTYYKGASESSSYLKLNKVMQWFTGNIGYHHIHHLNVHIPFYRLPEAMAAIPELQSPITTTLAPKEILECFRANLWDEDQQRVVSYREAGMM